MSAETEQTRFSHYHQKNMANPYYVIAFNERQNPGQSAQMIYHL
jgi:hypothetical protein